jgi:hypothetical protein
MSDIKESQLLLFMGWDLTMSENTLLINALNSSTFLKMESMGETLFLLVPHDTGEKEGEILLLEIS